ncbi:hypothetical protein AB0K53_16905 [Streptomyces tuirus]|uniref:hypothetical protein n=1 Tax=Streptomyces tuirus TaxID=68278 RepID=UPI003413B3B7
MATRRSKRARRQAAGRLPRRTQWQLSRTAITGLIRGASGALGALATAAIATWLRGQL